MPKEKTYQRQMTEDQVFVHMMAFLRKLTVINDAYDVKLVIIFAGINS